MLSVSSASIREWGLLTRLARTQDGELVAASRQAFDEMTERHGDAVDLGWKRFRDERDFQNEIFFGESFASAAQKHSQFGHGISRGCNITGFRTLSLRCEARLGETPPFARMRVCRPRPITRFMF